MNINVYKEQLIAYIDSLNLERPLILHQLIDAYCWAYSDEQIKFKMDLFINELIKKIENEKRGLNESN